MLDNYRFFEIDDPKFDDIKTNGSVGWCGNITKYTFYLTILILGLTVIINEIKNFGTQVGQSISY